MVNRLTLSVEPVGRSRPLNPSSRLGVTFALSLCLNEYNLRVQLKPFSTSMFVPACASNQLHARSRNLEDSRSHLRFKVLSGLLENGVVLGTGLAQSKAQEMNY